MDKDIDHSIYELDDEILAMRVRPEDMDECDFLGFNEGQPEGCPEDYAKSILAGLKAQSGYTTPNGVYINKYITKYNRTVYNNTGRIKFIVFHYCGAEGAAVNNASYFGNNQLKASAHYFVDNKEIWQVVEDRDASWHCGGGRQSSYGGAYFNIALNSNSIGIEMCCRKVNGTWIIDEQTKHNAAMLGYYLMNKYNVPANRVIRHFDVTGKYCPEPMVLSKDAEWTKFKNRVLNNDKGKDELTVAQIDEIMKAINNVDAKVNNINNRLGMVYAWVDKNMPEWARPTIQKLLDKGYLKGDEEGKLNLDMSMLRMLVILDRAGNFDIKK